MSASDVSVSSNQVILRDIVSPFCPLACDDLQVSVRDNRIVDVEGGCELCRERFLAAGDAVRPIGYLQGAPADSAELLLAAAETLSAARAPLVCGLAKLTCEAQALAVSLAETIGAAIDTGRVATYRGTALEHVGESTCTLGELGHRADLIIFWGRHNHGVPPRFGERFLRKRRINASEDADALPYVLSVEEQPGESTIPCTTSQTLVSTFAAEVLRPSSNSALAAASILRGLLAGRTFDEAVIEQATGVSLDRWRGVARRMRNCRYGVLCGAFDDVATNDAHAVAAVQHLAVEANNHTRFSSLTLPRSPNNAVGAEQVLAWRTGFSNSVNFAAGHPRYGSREYRLEELLARGEIDTVLTFDATLWTSLSEAARRQIDEVAAIVFNPWTDDESAEFARDHPHVRAVINTAVPGIEAAGTWFRFDGVPLPLRKVIDSALPTAEKVISMLISAIRQKL